MAPFRYLTKLSAAGFALLVVMHQASAITAEDVLKKMSDKERFSYLHGLVAMLAYQTAANGNRDKGNCIGQAFFGDDNDRSEHSWSRLHDVLRQYPDKRPEILVTVLADQLCKN